MTNPWTPEKYGTCPQCGHHPLLGRIEGPKATHQLRCEPCGWTGTTEKLSAILRWQVKEWAARPEIAKALAKLPPTKFVGYDQTECEATVVGIFAEQNPREPKP